MERSLHAEENGRVHLHCYFSWHGASTKGVDHRTTAAWVFQGVKPRVHINSEHRGPFHWLKAVQHGHFYVSLLKEGTLHSDTNYPPWDGHWVPDAWWVTALWKQHKLNHADYLALSARLREGHDKRKACIDVVIATESQPAYQEEKAAARKLIAAFALPFKPNENFFHEELRSCEMLNAYSSFQ